MKEFRISCPHCGRKIDFFEDKIGRFINCPACGLKVELKASAAKPATLAPTPIRRRLGYFIWAAAAMAAMFLIVWLSRENESGKSAASKSVPGSASGVNAGLSPEQIEKNNYWTNIAFTRMVLDRTDFGGVWGASVSFGIKNNGDRAVTGLKVTISLMGTNGVVCLQYPIVAFSGQTNAPLLPGESWGSDPNNPYIITEVPDSWHGGYDSAQVTDVQFSK